MRAPKECPPKFLPKNFVLRIGFSIFSQTKNMRTRILLFAALFFMAPFTKAQVSTTPFSQSMDVYQTINGTVVDAPMEDDVFHPNLPIGFTFVYNGVATNKFGICTNGFIVMDSAMHSSLWTLTGNNTNQLSALMADLKNDNAGGSIEYVTVGTAPNRVCVIQWKDYGIFAIPYCHLNVQIRLFEGTNCIQYVYGYNALSGTAGQPFFVGLTGANTSDFLLRTTNSSWMTSIPSPNFPGLGMQLNALNTVPSGLVFSFGGCLATGSPFAYISGKVYDDANNNGVQDVGENGLPNIMLHESVQNYYTVPDVNGNYNLLFVDSTLTYSLTALTPTYWNISSTPTTYSIQPLTQSVNNADFGLYATPNVHDVSINCSASNVPWPGATISLFATMHNAGTVTESGDSVFCILDSNYTMVSANPLPTQVIGDSLIWVYSSLLVNESRNIQVVCHADTTLLSGDSLHTQWIIQPILGDAAPANNQYWKNQVCVSSFDPNYKTVTPDGPIENTQLLAYTINFQNTGTAPAQNVFLFDTLDANVDVSTFKVLGSSFPVTYTLNGSGNLAFTFAGINLPDSNSNEPASHGAVTYSVLPKAGLTSGSKIHNTASIVFDFNTPVVTNTTENIITEAVPTGLLSTETNTSIKAYPNPVQHNICMTFDTPTQTAHVRILDVQGKVCVDQQITVQSGSANLNIDNLPKGFYLMEVKSKQQTQSFKLIKE